MWSDGCASQFKGCNGLFFVGRYPGLTKGCVMKWNFFGTAHGKGEWDGAGAVLKSKLCQEQIRNPGRRLQNVGDVVDFLRVALSSRVPSSYVSRNPNTPRKPDIFREFWHVPVNATTRRKRWESETIPGSSQFHSVCSVSSADPSKLMVRDLSCFCVPCTNNDWEACENACYCLECANSNWASCENRRHIQPWRLVKIHVKNPEVVREQMEEFGDGTESQFGDEDDSLADLLELGDNFAVPAEPMNKEGVQFYILVCLRKKFLVREAFTCKWGSEFSVGDYAIQRRYYQKWGSSQKSYVFLDKSKPAFISSDLVMAVKFAMPVQNHRVQGDDLYTPYLKLIGQALRKRFVAPPFELLLDSYPSLGTWF